MTTDKSLRVNLTLSQEDVARLKALYANGSFRENVSFTGFCQMLLMLMVNNIENGIQKVAPTPNMIRPGRPTVSE